MRIKNCRVGMKVCYNGSFSTKEVRIGDIGTVTDVSSHWVKVAFPMKESWYVAGQLDRWEE